MAYTPTNWKTGDTVTSTKLNKLENGVSGIASQVDDVEDEIGDLSELETTAKTDLVSAINEAAQSGGGGASIDLGITGATVGTYAKVKTVDANGKPTSWETGAGGGGGGGDVSDVQINGTSIVSSGVANIPVASSNAPGVIKVNGSGLNVLSSNQLVISKASDAEVKAGSNNYSPIVPGQQHKSVFYALAKAAGDTTQANSSNAVGTYTDDAKAAIQTMLGVSGDGVGDLIVVTVTGTTPTITAAASHRYKCGEVTELSFTPSATGICDVVFTSGTTATILTVPNTVKWPDGFDPTSLETSTTYELNVVDGTLGGVIKWQ